MTAKAKTSNVSAARVRLTRSRVLAMVFFLVAFVYLLYNFYLRRSVRVDMVILEPVLPSSGNFSYVLSPSDLCSSLPTLLIVVISAPLHLETRRVIRLTWGSIAKASPSSVRLAFLVGRTMEDMEERLRAEHRQHSDIILADFKDSYRNLTVKSVAMLQWVSLYCPKVRYMLKTDDDMFIHVPNLLTTLQNATAKKFIMGRMFCNATPILDQTSKWYTPNFPHKTYPNYVSGTAYLISGDAVKSLLHAALTLRLFWLEDIFITGMCSKAAGVAVVGNAAFSEGRRKLTWCAFKNAISGHEYTPGEIMKIWKALHEENHHRC